jgi:hypothetical protein
MPLIMHPFFNMEPALRYTLAALAISFTSHLMGATAVTTVDPLANVIDRALAIDARLGSAQAMFRSQLLGELDHLIGDSIIIAGTTLPARIAAKGQLELDLAGDGKFKSFSKSTTITIPASPVGAKRPIKLSLYLNRVAGGWTYRNVSQLSIAIGPETWIVCDVNGDGTFNQPAIDGMTLAGYDWLFPLPTADERFCSPTLNLTGLTISALGEEVKLHGRPLTTTVVQALPVLQDVNSERLKIGLTPRPEDSKLSAELQAHCHYMVLNKKLEHPETAGNPGYSAEGHQAGMRSILGSGTPANRLALGMTNTYFHRQDVIRPETLAFGVGYEGSYGGIDGRSKLGKAPTSWWPVLCPVPDQREVNLNYGKEAPDATPGDDRAGYPITAYFGTDKLKLTSSSLKAVAGSKNLGLVDCYTFDPHTGANADFTGYQRCVALIAKDPLEGGVTYEVSLSVDVDGKPWTKTWQFSTIGAPTVKPQR